MSRTLIKDLPQHIGQTVELQGFVDTVRDQKRMQFVVLRDQTGAAQLAHFKAGAQDELAATVSGLTEGSTLTVTGQVKPAPQVKLGGLEVELKTLDVTSRAASPLPIAADSSQEKQMDWRHVSLRRPENLLIFQVQTTMEHAMRQFWADNGFIEIHSPKLMGTASESGAELFELPYFNNRKAYLAQSPQFYKQMAMASGFDRVFEIGPVFRANPSFTSRHDTEFTSVDMEFAGVKSHEDVMQMEERWLASTFTTVAAKHGTAIKNAFGSTLTVPTVPFPRISLAEARDVLAQRGHVIDHKADLDPAGERKLSEHVREKHGHEFVFVTDYPADVRAFYHMRHENNPGLTKSFDLLWKGVEITTGAQREHRIERLEAQAAEKGLGAEGLKDYFNFFRYGCPPHGGCGVGLTRLLMLMMDRPSVRDVTYLYRGPNRLTP